VATLAGHSDFVYSVAFHPTAPLLATCSADKTAKLWRFSPDGSKATCVATLAGHSDFVYSVAFHPTAPLLATGSRDDTVKLWLLSSDNSSATCVATLEGHINSVLSIAFHKTAPLLATGSVDKTTKLWRLSANLSAATCVATLQGHNSWVRSVAFHPTALLLATGSQDKTIKLWGAKSEIKSQSEYIINNLKFCSPSLMNKYKEFEINLISKNIKQSHIIKLNDIITKLNEIILLKDLEPNCKNNIEDLLTNLNNVKTILETNIGKAIISWQGQEMNDIKSQSKYIIDNLKDCAKYLQKKYIEFNNNLINKNIEQPDINKIIEIIKVVDTKEFWEKQDECSKKKKDLLKKLDDVKTILETNIGKAIIS
jgi:WD40 repeat protein